MESHFHQQKCNIAFLLKFIFLMKRKRQISYMKKQYFKMLGLEVLTGSINNICGYYLLIFS